MRRVDWARWERLIAERGVEVDRPRGTDHPRYPGWTCPLDYGYIPETVGTDGRPVDVFVGTTGTGLRAALAVRHEEVEEVKLLWNTSEDEIARAVAFLDCELEVRLIRRIVDEV